MNGPVLRSWLFVPGDAPGKIDKAVSTSADALIFDLEDAVAPDRKAEARRLVAEHLLARRNAMGARAYVRINPIQSEFALEDLTAVLPGAPDGIVLPKPRSVTDVRTLSNWLDVLEVQNGLERGVTRILPVATETPEAIFALGEYAQAPGRLAGLTWGAEDLAAALGALDNKDPSGAWSQPYALARSLCLFAAGAANVPAIETLFANFRNAADLREVANRARRDGFSGMIAIHPAQIDVINAAFTPDDTEIERARHIVSLFESSPTQGAVALDGVMLDRPHLVQARKILAAARYTQPQEQP